MTKIEFEYYITQCNFKTGESMRRFILLLNEKGSFENQFLRETANNDPPGTRNKARPRNHPTTVNNSQNTQKNESSRISTKLKISPQMKMQRISWKIAWKLLATEDR